MRVSLCFGGLLQLRSPNYKNGHNEKVDPRESDRDYELTGH